MLPLHGDMADPEAPARAVAAAVERFGGLDGVVSNAGINRPGRLVDYAVRDWDAVFAVNTRATWLLAKAAHPALKAARGAIVAVASMSGSNAHANLGPYGPSKAAVIMLAKVLAQELGPDGIRVNTVSPGMVQTGMTAAVYADQQVAAERAALVPLGRVAGPEDMADVIAFLLGPDARYVNGHDLVVDGGVAGNYLGRLPGTRAHHAKLTGRVERGLRRRGNGALMKDHLPPPVDPLPDRAPQQVPRRLFRRCPAGNPVRHQHHAGRQDGALELRQRPVDRRLVAQGRDDLRLVEDPSRAPELHELVREQVSDRRAERLTSGCSSRSSSSRRTCACSASIVVISAPC